MKKGNIFTYMLMIMIIICIILISALLIFGYITSNDITILTVEKEIEVSETIVNQSLDKNQINNTITVQNPVLPIIMQEPNQTEGSTNQSYNNHYYYQQLNEQSKIIYDAVEKNITNMQSGRYKVELPQKLSDILQTEGGEEVINNAFQSAWDALRLDRVDIFYLNLQKISLITEKTVYRNKTSYMLSLENTNNESYLSNYFQTTGQVKSAIAEVETIRQEIIKNIKGNDYQKVLEVHDWIIEHFEYDQSQKGTNSYNIYGGLINRNVVCEGYAKTFKYLLDAMEITNVLICGTGTNAQGNVERHEWNAVMIEGKWYALDTTWDDPIVQGGGSISNKMKHQYFLVGKDTISKDHIEDGKISETGKNFQYPQVNKENYYK